MDFVWLIVVVIFIFLWVLACWCKVSKKANDDTPVRSQDYNINEETVFIPLRGQVREALRNNLPIILETPPSDSEDTDISMYTPRVQNHVTPYPPAPPPDSEDTEISMHTSQVQNNVTPYPPAPPPESESITETPLVQMPQPMLSNGTRATPVHVFPYPTEFIALGPSNMLARSAPQLASDSTSSSTRESRRHSVEDLPPSYAEAVERFR